MMDLTFKDFNKRSIRISNTFGLVCRRSIGDLPVDKTRLMPVLWTVALSHTKGAMQL